jgi:ADP-ribose pyrophosphatase YjhB (NUDIX family)
MAVDPTPSEVSPEFWASLPRKRVGAGLLITDSVGRLLLVEPTYKPGWEVPGGVVEWGESPRAAAHRETVEELGVKVEVGRLLVVDWVPPGRRPDDGLMLLYAAGQLATEQIVLQQGELRSWRWCTIDEVLDRTTPFMARRLAAGLRALSTGQVAELEDGYP